MRTRSFRPVQKASQAGFSLIEIIVVVVLIALWIEPPATLLVTATLYAVSGPVMWFRRRRLDAAA